jgi:hypothetical protein
MIIREKINEIVEVFYQQNFKTFYINSIDGKTFVKPVGVFVSLGITTSMKAIEDIRSVIANTEGYSAIIAEISSKKVGNQFLNTIVNLETPTQYRLDNFGDNILNKEKAEEELQKLKEKMNIDEDIKILQLYAPKISKLQDLIDKLTISNGWDDHSIMKEDDDYKIYHQKINYKKDGNIEYRIGIFVSENKKL